MKSLKNIVDMSNVSGRIDKLITMDLYDKVSDKLLFNIWVTVMDNAFTPIQFELIGRFKKVELIGRFKRGSIL